MGKILLVDDSTIICQKTKAPLKENHQVEIAASGAKAFEKIEETDFDLILLDIEMPEMSGFDVCRKLRSEKKTELLPVVVFYTDHVAPDTRVEGLHLGASDFITKPQARSHPGEFLARIESHLRIAQLTRDQVELEKLRTLRATAVSVKHEVANPLFIISLNADRMRDCGLCKPKVCPYYDHIKESITRINNVLEKLILAVNPATEEYAERRGDD